MQDIFSVFFHIRACKFANPFKQRDLAVILDFKIWPKTAFFRYFAIRFSSGWDKRKKSPSD